MVTWDESKRLSNRATHGLDFAGCEAVFDREAYGEQRIALIGWLGGQFVQMAYTERGGDMHVISLRKANKHEIEAFYQALSGS